VAEEKGGECGMRSVSLIEISPSSLLVMSMGATREVVPKVRGPAADLGEGARESVSRQNIQEDEETDMSDTSEVVAVVEEMLALLIGKIVNMLDLEVVGRV
jgi:hypothetical protein